MAHNSRLKPREYEDVLKKVMRKIYDREIWIPDYSFDWVRAYVSSRNV